MAINLNNYTEDILRTSRNPKNIVQCKHFCHAFGKKVLLTMNFTFEI